MSNHACKVYPHADSMAKLSSQNRDGGKKQSYKVWGIATSAGRAPHLDVTPFLQATMGTSLDVCYCDDDCDDPRNFFKVGTISTTVSFGLAFKSNASDAGLDTLQIVNQPGTLTLFSGQTTRATDAKVRAGRGPA